jgi:hypothetical protein
MVEFLEIMAKNGFRLEIKGVKLNELMPPQ